jgi:hypothetical protein
MELTINYENEADEILQYHQMHYNCHLNQNVDSFEDHLNIQLNVLEMNIDSKKLNYFQVLHNHLTKATKQQTIFDFHYVMVQQVKNQLSLQLVEDDAAFEFDLMLMKSRHVFDACDCDLNQMKFQLARNLVRVKMKHPRRHRIFGHIDFEVKVKIDLSFVLTLMDFHLIKLNVLNHLQ